MKKIIYLILLIFLFGCKKEDKEESSITVCVDCTELYSGWYAFPAFCGTPDEADRYITKLMVSQVPGKIDYDCNKYIQY